MQLSRRPASVPARLGLVLGAVAALLAAGAGVGSPASAGGAARSGGARSSPPTPAECLALTGGRCVTPAGLRAAYDLDGLLAAGTTGAGVSIGIVDSFGSPTIAHDIAVYDAQYGLPALDLQILTPAGTPPAFDPGSTDMGGWADETTLDVEVAHTVAPGAKIVLIETPTSETEGITGFPDIVTAERYVVSHRLVDVLSQSFAATEATFTSPQQVRELSTEVYPAAKAAGITVLSSSGDNGPTDLELDQKTLYDTPETDWPASDPLVTSVGGTRLDIGADGTKAGPDAAWGGLPLDNGGAGGGGLSTVFPRPTFQASVAAVVGDHRGVPDIALDAALSSGLVTFSSYAGDDWSVGGGTSQAAPLLAGIVALADQQAKARVGYLDDVLYGTLAREPAGGIVDVTHGDTDIGGRVPGYRAVAGYDLATGLGTVDGGRFVPALVAATKGHTEPLAAAGGPTSPPPTSSAPSGTTSGPATAASPFIGPGGRAPSTVHHDTAAAVIAGVALVVVAAGVGVTVVRRRRRAR